VESIKGEIFKIGYYIIVWKAVTCVHVLQLNSKKNFVGIKI